MKYDFIAMGRIILPIFGISFIFSLLGRLYFMLSPYMNSLITDTFTGIFITIAILLFGCISFAILLITAVHFYQNFSSKNGYLTFSVPASATEHYFSHLLVSGIYLIAGYLVSAICIVTIIPGSFTGISYFFSLLSDENAVAPFLLTLLLIFLILVFNSFYSQSRIYTAVAFGTQSNKGRVAISIGAYFCIGIVGSIFSSMVSSIFVMNISQKLDAFSYINDSSTLFYSIASIIGILFAIYVIIWLILGTIQFFICRYMFTKRLNLV